MICKTPGRKIRSGGKGRGLARGGGRGPIFLEKGRVATIADSFKVRMVEQLKPHPTRKVITGYLVYAWIGHPLLGKVRGTERRFKSEKEAKKYAAGLRRLAKGGK